MPRAQTHLEVQADEMQADEDEEEDEELFEEWAPGLLRATPERPAFTPTPPSSVRA